MKEQFFMYNLFLEILRWIRLWDYNWTWTCGSRTMGAEC